MDALLPAAAGLLLAAAFLAALAAYSLRDFSFSRLEDVCRRRGREDRFSEILRRHERTLLSIELCQVLLLSAAAAAGLAWLGVFDGLPGNVLGWSLLGGQILLAMLVLELAVVLLPWSVSRVGGERFLCRMWPLMGATRGIFAPLWVVLRRLDRFMHRLSGLPEPTEGDAAAIADEIRTVIDEGQREGALEVQARSMIHRVMELQGEDVAAIMTPRTDMVSLHVDATFEEARRKLLDAGHSRVPVIGESTDDIVGILYAKDLLRYINGRNGQEVTLREIVREPLYVPETTGIDTLLERMKRERVHIAIVIDEYGGVSGLVTMEDILEEIVGEIVDEYDVAEEAGIHPISPGVIEVASRVHIDDLNEQFKFDLPEDGDFDTIGGFVFSHLGRVPQSRESFTWKNLRITVLKAGKRKIHRLRIEADESPAAAPVGDE